VIGGDGCQCIFHHHHKSSKERHTQKVKLGDDRKEEPIIIPYVDTNNNINNSLGGYIYIYVYIFHGFHSMGDVHIVRLSMGIYNEFGEIANLLTNQAL